MDLQLTNIEHFSECDIQAKIKQLRVGLFKSGHSNPAVLSQYFRPFQSPFFFTGILTMAYKIKCYSFIYLYLAPDMFRNLWKDILHLNYLHIFEGLT